MSAAVEVKVNGRPLPTTHTTVGALRLELFAGAQNLVTILNGFALAADAPLAGGDELVFIEKGKLPPEDELEAMMSARHTPGVYQKVKAARVAIAGLGGLGSTIAIALARTGVGHLHLVDFDVVEPSNLNRQQYKIKHLGLYKTEAMRQEIAEINPFLTVSIDTERVTEDNVATLFAADAIICEAFDNPDAKALLINGILGHCPGKKIVAGSGMAGFASSNRIETRRVFPDLYVCGDRETDARIGRGLMAPRVSVCAGHQANMVLRLLLGEEET